MCTVRDVAQIVIPLFVVLNTICIIIVRGNVAFERLMFVIIMAHVPGLYSGRTVDIFSEVVLTASL